MIAIITLKARPADYVFEEPLIEGTIVNRPNRFVMNVIVDGSRVKAHCPNTGKIGSVIMDGLPVLLSFHPNPERKYKWTTEAISYNRPEMEHKEWIGINTGATNRYVQTFLEHNMFPDIVDVRVPSMVKREVKLGDSRIDFKVGDTYIEVKSWTQIIEKVVPSWVTKREVREHEYSAASRLVKHANTLTNALQAHQRCVMIGCYQYVPDKDEKLDRYDYGQYYSDSNIIREAFDKAQNAGVEYWTCTMSISPDRVKLIRYWKDG